MTIERIPLEQRFWKYVNKTDGCWLWTGKARREFGYGAIAIGGKNGGAMPSHRASWLIHFGDIPDGMCVCHTCDVPACVRPDHLFLGTRSDNNKDMALKNRYDKVKRAKGERHGMRKLSESDVIQIRELYKPGETPLRTVAATFGVSLQTISRIINKKNWKHL